VRERRDAHEHGIDLLEVEHVRKFCIGGRVVRFDCTLCRLLIDVTHGDDVSVVALFEIVEVR
jgi:hypothetical protein